MTWDKNQLRTPGVKYGQHRISDDRDHKVETENPALIAAEMLCETGGTIKWDIVAGAAIYADLPESNKRDLEQLRQEYLARAK